MTNLIMRMRVGALIACLHVLAAPALGDELELARAILARTPVFDGHNDVAIKVRTEREGRLAGFEFERLPDAQRSIWHTDLERMRRGGIGAQFWSVYVPATLARDEAVRMTLEQIDIAHRLIEKYPGTLSFAGSANEVEEAMRRGRIASLLGAEGGAAMGDSLAVLRRLYALGVRYMTLTHAKSTRWADSATDAPRHGGLSPFGVETIREMNRIGMLIDLSHVSAETMHDALDASVAPVIFSHSNATGVLDHPRNVPDDVLARLALNGGITMATFIPVTLSAEYGNWTYARAAEVARAAAAYPSDTARAQRALREWESANPKPHSTLTQVADHIDHLRRVAGIDHIGIGSDWDGLRDLPLGLQAVDQLPNLFAELIRRGYTEADLAKIAQRNMLRVLRRAEYVARRLQHEWSASEVQLDPQ